MHLSKTVILLILLSILLQPSALVGVAFAETVEMEYPAPTDPDPKHIHAPKVVNGVSYKYDANGNLTYDGERSIFWNQDNLPIRLEKDGEVVEFFYDANGRRIVKRSGEDKTVYVNNYYQQSTINNQQSSAKYYFANGRTAQSVNGTLSFLHNDHLGSTVLATDSQSQPTSNSLSYFPYGSLVNNLTIHRFEESPLADQFSNYLFTGQELDPESDLYNYLARLYNPTTGSFISADSVGSGNRYAYAANNPLLFTDPTGHMLDAGGGGGGGRPYLPLITKNPYDAGPATTTAGFGNFAPTAVANATAVSSAQLSSYYYSPEYQQALREQTIDFTINFTTIGLATYNLMASIPAIISYLQFSKDFYYYNYFYSAPAPPLQAPVGDTLQMSSATGYTELARGMSKEAWAEYYQASRTLTEEWGVKVYDVSDEVFDAVANARGLPSSSGAVYIFGEGSPGYMYVRSSRPAMEKTLMLAHEFKHFQYDMALGFPGGVTPAQMAFTEFDAYRFYLANPNLLTPKALGIAEGESWYWYKEATRLLGE